MSVRKVLFGAGAHAVGNVAAQLLSLAVLAVIARSLDVEQYGRLLANFYFLVFLTSVVAYGYTQWAIVKLAKFPLIEAAVAKRITQQRLILATLLFPTYGIWLAVAHPPLNINYFIISCVTLLAFAVDRRYEFISSLTAWKTSLLNPIGQLFSLLACLVFFNFGKITEILGLSILASAVLLPPFISYFLSTCKSKEKSIGGHYQAQKEDSLSIHRIGIGNIFLAVTVNLTPVLVLTLFAAKFAGLFSAAYRIIGILLMGFGLFHSFLMPLLAKISDDHNKLRKFIFQILSYQAILSILVALLLWFFGELILKVVFGKEFIGAIDILRPLGIGLIFISPIAILLVNVLLATGNHKQYFAAVILSPILGLGAMMILASPLGTSAAIAGLLIGELTIVCISGYTIYFETERK